MAGALSLRNDILALVKKHSDTCLAQDLLMRLGEEARLMCTAEQIRSLHEADPFGLFSEPRDDAAEEEQEPGEEGEDGDREGASGVAGKRASAFLPENVKRMLEMMRITRVDNVAALSGFTTIDAEVEFSRSNIAISTKSDDDTTNNNNESARRRPTPRKSPASTAAGAGESVEEFSSSSPSSSEEEDEDAEAPVFLTFRFRREPLPRGNTDTDDSRGPNVGGGGSSSEFGNLAANDSDDNCDRAGGGEAPQQKGDAMDTFADGGETGTEHNRSGSGTGGGRKEGRKRAGSRGGDGDSEGEGGGRGGAGGCQARKRSKGTMEREGDAAEMQQEAEEEEEGGDGEDADGERKAARGSSDVTFEPGYCTEDAELDSEGLDYEPRTLVSYSISGAIGFKASEVLLQAVVYARGDGPAGMMPPPPTSSPLYGQKEDGSEEGRISNDQEDVSDCSVNGPALAAVGRALGLYTEDPSPPPSELDSDSDVGDDVGEAGGARDKRRSQPRQERRQRRQQRQRLSGAGSGEDEPRDRGGGVGRAGERSPGGMTLSDLVWWLLLFPFFEKEFDMVEVVASSVFSDDDSNDSDDGGGGGFGGQRSTAGEEAQRIR